MKPVEYMVHYRKDITRVCQDASSVSAAWDSLRDSLPDFELSFTVFQRHVPMLMAMMELMEQETKERDLQEAKALEEKVAELKALEEKALQEKTAKEKALEEKALMETALKDQALATAALQDQALPEATLKDKVLAEGAKDAPLAETAEEERQPENLREAENLAESPRPQPKRRAPYHEKREAPAYYQFDKKRPAPPFRKDKNQQSDSFRNDKKYPSPYPRNNKKAPGGYVRNDRKDAPPQPFNEVKEPAAAPKKEKVIMIASPHNEKKALIAALKASKPHVRKGVVPMAIVLAEYNQAVSTEMKAANAAALREKLMTVIGNDIDFTWTMYMGANNLCLPWNGAVDDLLA